MDERYQKWFVSSAGALLLVTGLAKLLSAFGTARVLAVQDPLIGLSYGNLLPIVGIAEVMVAVACFSGRVQLRLKVG